MPLEDDRRGEERQHSGRQLFRKLFSNSVLIIIVSIYVVGGALMFQHIEEQGVLNAISAAEVRAVDIDKERDQLIDELWMHKQEKDYENLVDKLIENYQKNLTEAIGKHGYQGRPFEEGEKTNGWSFPSAVLFAITVVTTIGYGHVAPKTELGQVLLIVYSIVGTPLMLIVLAMVGDSMANFFRMAYSRGCCRLCFTKQEKEHVKAERQSEQDAFKKKKQRHEDLDSDGLDYDRKRSVWSVDFHGDENEADGDLAKGVVTTRIVEETQVKEFDWNEIDVPISIVLVVIFVYVMLGAVLFASWNEWTVITGAYFRLFEILRSIIHRNMDTELLYSGDILLMFTYSFVTLSTIGFGDLVPGWTELGTTKGTIKLIISNVYIVFGMAVLSMSFNLIIEEMLQKIKFVGKKMRIIESDEVPGDEAVMSSVTNEGGDEVIDGAETETLVESFK